MIKNPRLTYCYHAEFIGDDNVLLSSEKDNVLLTERSCCLVLSAITQNDLSLDDLLARLDEEMPYTETLYTVVKLSQAGYITEAESTLSPEELAFWSGLGMDPGRLAALLTDKTVSIVSTDTDSPAELIHALSQAGLKVQENADLTIVITGDYEDPMIRQINLDALKSKKPWMLLKTNGIEPWLGPLFIPGKTACWECLANRLSYNRQINTFFKAHTGMGRNLRIPSAGTPLSRQTAAGLAVQEIVKWLYSGTNDRLEGTIITLSNMPLDMQSHLLVRRPQCPACGKKDYRIAPRPVTLKKNRASSASLAGGYREASPEATFKKYRHHISTITGVVQKLTPYHAIANAPMHNFSSGHNMAFRSKSMHWLNNHVRSGCGGKGASRSQAKAGALCEAIERYSLTWHGDEPRIKSSLTDLGEQGIHPNDCMNFSQKQFQDREALNRECSRFYALIPVPFDETEQMHWTPVWSMGLGEFCYLPSCFCYAQYPVEDEQKAYAYPDSNGCAAGNSVAEAALQGFLELVERDSVALWWYNRLEKPSVDLTSFNQPYFQTLSAYYKSIERSLTVLDLTSDLGIPAFGAISHRLNNEREDIVFGFGAHVDATIAVERALVELNQILPIVHPPKEKGGSVQYLTGDKNFLSWLDSATMENQPYLSPGRSLPPKTLSDYKTLCEPSVEESLNLCILRAAEKGMDTLILDMTRPDVGLNVVKVMVPGLRHFWRRLAPGRLYDAPVGPGLLDRPLEEHELNPVGLFI